MILTAFILSPMLIAMGMMIQFHVRKKRWIPLVTNPTLIFIFIFHCVIMTAKWHLKMDIPAGLLEARAWAISLIFPLIYIFICSKSGEDWRSINTVTILGFGLFNLSNGTTLYLDDIIVDPYPTDNALHLMLRGKSIVTIGIQETVLMLQMIWITVRSASMYNKGKQKNLHLSKKSLALLKTMAFGFAVAITSIFVPDNVWENSVLFPWAFFIPLSVCLTYAELLVSWGYALTPILDENDEPAMNTVTVDDSILKQEITELIEGQRLYLDADIKIEDISKRLNTNRSYISRTINELFGCNFSTYLNRLRIRHAENLLRSDPNINLELLASRSGFNSAGSFTKVFKKETGVNPSNMKKSLLRDMQYKMQ